MRTLLFFFLFISSACSHTLLRTTVDEPDHVSIRPNDEQLCNSWMLLVETNNAGPWEKVPKICIPFVKSYLQGDQFYFDSEAIAQASLRFADTVEIAGDGKDVWIFDIDETLLTFAEYFPFSGARPAGSELPLVPALPASLNLYNLLLHRGFTIVLLTGRTEDYRDWTNANLRYVGYRSWQRLIMRGKSDVDKTATVYKSEKRAELVAEGYRLHGNSGDQWSDLLGSSVATRSFKLPNPMYYAP